MEKQEIAEILERFVLNARKMASKDQKQTIISLAKTADSPQEGFTKALFFILKAVHKGLEKKGVSVPPEMYVMGNGMLSEVAQDVAKILAVSGFKMSKEELTNAIKQTAVLLEELFTGKAQQGNGIAEGDLAIKQGQEMPQNQPSQPQQPQGMLPQQGVPQ